jgi:hypothetical protein
VLPIEICQLRFQIASPPKTPQIYKFILFHNTKEATFLGCSLIFTDTGWQETKRMLPKTALFPAIKNVECGLRSNVMGILRVYDTQVYH